MANQIAKLSNIGNILGLKGREFTFQDPALISAPSTQITDLYGSPRKIADPSKTLRPALGLERLPFKYPILVDGEKGPNGEQVWRSSTGDNRIRLVGTWGMGALTDGSFVVSTVANDFIEISFYGTGLNILGKLDGARDWRATVDGGAEGANFINFTGAGTLGGRSYNQNQVAAVVTGLALGNHTVKIRHVSGNIVVYGFEIQNTASQIKVPQGEIFSAGRKYTNPTLASLDYNTGFDGSPVLNGRGGHVVHYLTDSGQNGKVIQQTDAAAAYLSSANHANEEVIQKINWRDFGANRSDDFSTFVAPGIDTNTFTLEDGTTSLTSHQVNITGTLGPSVWPATSGSWLMITFIGTGLDIIRSDSGNGTLDSHTILVNNASVGTITSTGSTTLRVEKICSGLPYGTHTVQILRPSAVNQALGVADFIIYGPKKPAIPANSVESMRYYLMADFSAAGVAGVLAADNADMYQGTIHKATVREMVYVGTWVAPTFDSNFFIPSGNYPNTTTNASYMEYVFWGTGIGIHFIDSAGGTVTYSVTIDGVANATGANLVSTTNNGAGSYTTNTAVGGRPARLTFTGLSMGPHTIRITRTGGAGGMAPVALHVITPIHFPSTKIGSLGMGPAVQMNDMTNLGGIDLGNAKAWMVYNMATDTIVSAYNISNIIELVSLQTVVIRWEKPFKTEPIIIASNTSGQGISIRGPDNDTTATSSKKFGCVVNSGAGSTNMMYVVAYGELNEEEQ